MPDRRRQIELLIATRFDHLWFPSGALRTQSGLAPSKRVACPACGTGERPGWLPVRRSGVIVRWDPCGSCGGRQEPRESGNWLKRDAGKGVIAVDPMDVDQRTVGSADTQATAQPRKRVKCDACQSIDGTATGVVNGQRCPRCDGTGMRDLHVFDLRLDHRDGNDTGSRLALDVAIDRRDELGDWHPLEKALALIHRQVNKPLRFAALTVYAKQATDLLDDVNLHEHRTYAELSSFERELYDLAITFIHGLMPDPIRVPADVVANRKIRAHRPVWVKGSALTKLERERRDKQIRSWAREGKAYTWIGQQAGLSDRQVREIINGTRSAA